jgi:hypothetical protein
MKKIIFTVFYCICIFLAGCQPGARVIFPGNIKNIVINNISVPSQILSCVAEAESMTSKQLHEQFVMANESFQISGSDEDRFQLICLCLVWSDSPVTLDLGTSLLSEYLISTDSAGEDVQGFIWLLKSFDKRLKKKDLQLNESEAKANALNSQLEKLKNIEKILNERSN